MVGLQSGLGTVTQIFGEIVVSQQLPHIEKANMIHEYRNPTLSNALKSFARWVCSRHQTVRCFLSHSFRHICSGHDWNAKQHRCVGKHILYGATDYARDTVPDVTHGGRWLGEKRGSELSKCHVDGGKLQLGSTEGGEGQCGGLGGRGRNGVHSKGSDGSVARWEVPES